jgi:hypothetical protein
VPGRYPGNGPSWKHSYRKFRADSDYSRLTGLTNAESLQHAKSS